MSAKVTTETSLKAWQEIGKLRGAEIDRLRGLLAKAQPYVQRHSAESGYTDALIDEINGALQPQGEVNGSSAKD